ncbi:GyrI-like small molecule binding domain-containing protein [Paenibacillus sp. 1_12]|uniref:GyrI-like domain-containing protein n=1 Tax=Paenibacillus sp. 1_12 TaxID=1566278 RepID=UPI0008DF9871|nr:GyrI-like small molecule binding domain-containing protein [Paenibacillus sp. 1_12]
MTRKSGNPEGETDPENYIPSKDKFEYFIGLEVSEQYEIPVGMVCRTIPANEYVVFTFKGKADNAGRVHKKSYTNGSVSSKV